MELGTVLGRLLVLIGQHFLGVSEGPLILITWELCLDTAWLPLLAYGSD